MRRAKTSNWLSLGAFAMAFVTLNCVDLKEIAPMVEVGRKTPPAEEVLYDFLSYEGKVGVLAPYTTISALGTNGRRSFLYFGDKGHFNTLFAFNLATNKLTALPTKVKDKSHSNEGTYDAASDKTWATKNPADETLVTSIVAGPLDSAVASLMGLLHRHGGVIGTAAQGGVLEVENDTIKGIWGNVIGSLNSGDSKEISALAAVKDSWVTFSKDENGVGAFRRFNDALGAAKEGPTGPEGKAFGTIITAALGSGSELFVAYDGAVKRADTSNMDELCALDLGKGAEPQSIAVPKDLQILKGGSEVIVVSALAMVGRKLLIGMTNYGQNGGGVAVVNLEKETPTITPPPKDQLGISITHMAVSENSESALIITDGKGIIYFTHDQFYRLSDVKDQKESDNHPFVFQATHENQEAFDTMHAKGGAVYARGNWYIATDNQGIISLKSEKKKKSLEPQPLDAEKSTVK